MEKVTCNRCKTDNEFYVQHSGPHLKAICNNCDRYIKFINKNKQTLPDEQPVYNNMSQMISCSICLTDLVVNAQSGHSAFTRGKNGKVYVNLLQWLNEEEDQYKNHASFQLNSHKDKQAAELEANGGKKIYVGNGKIMSSGGAGQPVAQGEVKENLENLPF